MRGTHYVEAQLAQVVMATLLRPAVGRTKRTALSMRSSAGATARCNWTPALVSSTGTLGHAVADGLRISASGAAHGLVPRKPVALGDGPHGLGGATGDVFLCAGQTLSVAAGQHAVVEPLGGALLQYRWSGLEDATTAASQRWWRWAAKVPAQAPYATPLRSLSRAGGRLQRRGADNPCQTRAACARPAQPHSIYDAT